MPIEVIKPQRLYRKIAEQLRALIRAGEFAVGSRLPAERKLAKRLGVSRPSVREALIALEVEHVIEVRSGSGIYVLTPKARVLAREKAVATALQQMREQVAQGLIAREGGEAFHNPIARACGNDVLRDTVCNYWQTRRGPLFERLGDCFEDQSSWDNVLLEHAAVLEAIRVHNAGADRSAMQRHLKRAHNRYIGSWRRANPS